MPELGTEIPEAVIGAPEARLIAIPLPWGRITLVCGFIGAALLLLWLGYAQWRQLRPVDGNNGRR